MKILVVDYSGHPFQIQLSKQLAKNGHKVTHIYCASFSTPHGNMSANDIKNFNVAPIELSSKVDKSSFIKRRNSDKEFGRRLINFIAKDRPESVILSNMPMDSLPKTVNFLQENNIPYIFWLQDIYHVAIRNVLNSKLPLLGSLIGLYYKRIELNAFLEAKHLITITKDFNPLLLNWGVSSNNVTTIPNWAPLDELPVLPKENEWSINNGLNEQKVVLYSGTLGYKHNPDMLISLGKRLKGKAKLVIISEGKVADYVKKECPDIQLMPFQDFRVFPHVLATANVLIGVLEKTAGIFSVPSKVLSYLCSGRPIVLSSPIENLASKILLENNAGYVTNTDQSQDFIGRTLELIEDPQKALELGSNGRSYAENNFNIVNIAEKFEKLIKA